MTVNFEKVSQVFADRIPANEIVQLQETYADLMARSEPYYDVPKGGDLGDALRIRSYAAAYRQVLLHRAIYLFEGSLDAAIADNAYVMILAVRGAFETTAALGYLHNRLSSLTARNLEAQKVDEDIMTLMLGTKEASIPQAMDPKQVLNMLEYADKSVSRTILGGTPTEHKLLRESYDFLCEFAHSNFHSNIIAFTLDKSRGRLTFRYAERMPDEAFSTVRYLLIASSLHVHLHDHVDEVLPNVP